MTVTTTNVTVGQPWRNDCDNNKCGSWIAKAGLTVTTTIVTVGQPGQE